MFQALLLPILFAQFAVVNVCSSGCAYSTVEDAVRKVESGAEIVISPGEYHERLPLKIEKPLTIRGSGAGVTIVGDGEHDILFVTAPDVTVKNLTLRDGGSSYLHEIAAVRVEGAKNCTIRNNRLERNAYGVYLANAESCTVSENDVSGDSANESEAGNGIHSWSGTRHVIRDNTVRGHRDGIYIEFTTDSVIRKNRTSENIRYGLHFMSAHRNEYSENRFERNGAGVAVMYSRDIRMTRNVFADNTGAAAYGLLLKDISNGEIRENKFANNTIGLYMEGTNRSRLRANTFRQNGYALRILADCDNNSVEENSFLGNTFDVATNSNRNPNSFDRNYWSSYAGYDLDFDGVGDVPYRPVSLSSVLVEKFDSTFVLIGSPLLFALDQVEQAFPTLIPESLRDMRPLMTPAVQTP